MSIIMHNIKKYVFFQYVWYSWLFFKNVSTLAMCEEDNIAEDNVSILSLSSGTIAVNHHSWSIVHIGAWNFIVVLSLKSVLEGKKEEGVFKVRLILIPK